MSLQLAQYALGVLSGGLVGFALGLFGGGGSILAVPLMVYLVGIRSAHLALGTSALAVAANAASSLLDHARHGTVKWRSACVYSATGVLGAVLGSEIGKAIDGRRLLILFALLMVAVAAMMLATRDEDGDPGAECTRANVPKVLGLGAATGAFAGFFGIGGGFLIVPGLIASTGMPMICAVSSSLVVVCAFSLTTAASYALSGLVDVPLACVFVFGGLVGSRLGCRASRRLAARTTLLKPMFATLVFLAAGYMIAKEWLQI